MPELLVMRHGKSDWDAGTRDDHSRPLARRGIRSARLIGRFLNASGRVPDLIITSTAVRAASTAQLVAEALSDKPRVRAEDALYGIGATHVLRTVGRIGGNAERIMVVGHEPTWSQLVSYLVGARVEMKTASVAGVGLLFDDWSQLDSASGRLDFLVHPRMLFGSEWDQELT